MLSLGRAAIVSNRKIHDVRAHANMQVPDQIKMSHLVESQSSSVLVALLLLLVIQFPSSLPLARRSHSGVSDRFILGEGSTGHALGDLGLRPGDLASIPGEHLAFRRADPGLKQGDLGQMEGGWSLSRLGSRGGGEWVVERGRCVLLGSTETLCLSQPAR